MKHDTENPFGIQWRYVLPIPILLLILLAGFWVILPRLIAANALDDATTAAVTTASYFKTIRGYYTSNVVGKVVRDGNLQPMSNHASDPNGIPLPATLIHDIGELLAEENTSLKLFSSYPFPNRSDRRLDDFQKEAWDFLEKRPDDIFRRVETVNGRTVVRVAVGDKMVTAECVNCHNRRADSPKTDWKLGDLRGVLEVSTGLDSLITQGSSRSNKISQFAGLATFILLGILGFHLRSVVIRSRSVERLVSKRTTELATATQKLKDTYQRIGAVVDTVVDGIVTIDERGIIENFNPAAERIFGYSRSEVAGQNVKILMPEPYSREHDGYLRNYGETRKAKVIGIGREVEGRRKDGSTFPLDLAISEMEIDERRMFTGIVRDITERKRIEGMKREFVSTVSHELRTPLTSINGSLGLLTSGVVGQMSSEADDLVNVAYKNSQRLTHLINDLLDIEKLAAGQMNLDLQPLELLPLIEQALTENETYGAERRVKLRLTESEPALQVRVDAQRLMQVLSNLISNAVKYSPEDGTVRISLKSGDGHVRVTVTDDGPGVPAEFQSRIFEKFSQADSSDTRKKGGSGLGLAISRDLVEHMDGRIGFESVEGEGASFFFELPISSVDGPKPVDDPVGPATANAPRILVVEDDHDAARLLSQLLSRAGYSVDVATNGERALEALQEGDYGLLMLDLMLPDVSGLEIIHRVRAQAETADLPIMVVSGKMEEGELAINGDSANVDWWPKPIEETRLLTAVQNRLRWTRGQNLRVLHVEDDADLLKVVRLALREYFEVESALSVAEARSRLSREHFDLVLLDITLPDGSGWDLLPEIRSGLPEAQVIVLSGMEVTSEATRKVEAVLLKSKLSPQQLLDAIATQVGLTMPEEVVR